MTDYAGTFERYFREYSDNGLKNSPPAVRLAISFVLGAIIGVERQFRRRDAGMRTFTLICMGSAAAMLISIWIPQTYPNFLNGDPGGVSPPPYGSWFLGSRSYYSKSWKRAWTHYGSCIWVMAVVGLARYHMYLAASITTAFTLFVLVSLERLEQQYVFRWCLIKYLR